jgi:hypothetical protein
MSSGKTGLWTARSDINQLQGFHSNGFWHLLQVSGGKRSKLQRGSRLISRGLLPPRDNGRGRMEAAKDAWSVPLQRGQYIKTRSDAGEIGVGVRRILMSDDLALLQELDHLAPPNTEQRAHIMTALRRHAAKTRQPATAQQVKGHAFHQVVGGVRDGDHSRAGVDTCAVKKCIADLARRGLHGTLGQGCGASLCDERNSQPPAKRGNLLGHHIGTGAQRVVVMRRHDVITAVMQSEKQGGRVGTARDSGEDAIAWSQ